MMGILQARGCGTTEYNSRQGSRHNLGLPRWLRRGEETDMHDADKNDALPRHYPTEDELAQMAIAHGIPKDEVAVAITRDGKVYVGRAMPPTKLQQTLMRSRFLMKLLTWTGKLDHFFFVRVLRLPYLLDWIRTVNTKRKRSR